ncbi:MAG TPA: DUF1801 domain-containing protein [Verrucomicrobiae bacterium]|nr:DUF1801 domain-containing protein [Verrucomicrobiae bacterium]
MTPRQQLEKWMAKYDPAIAAQAKKALAKMRKLAPGTNELVYDNYNALVIGFAPGDRASAAMLSIALYPKYLSLFFLHGRDLPDPAKRLQGNGKQVRWIRLESERTLDEPEVRELVNVALHRASVAIDPKRKRRMEIRAAVKKQRPRRAPKK